MQPLSQRGNTAPLQKHILLVSFVSFPLNGQHQYQKWAIPPAKPTIQRSMAHVRNKKTSLESWQQIQGRQFHLWARKTSTLPWRRMSSFLSTWVYFSPANSNISHDADSSQITVHPTPHHDVVQSTGELTRAAAARWENSWDLPEHEQEMINSTTKKSVQLIISLGVCLHVT